MSFLQGAGFPIHLYKFLAYFSEDVECIYLVLRLTKWVSWSGNPWEEEQALPPPVCEAEWGSGSFLATLAARLCGANFVQEKHLSMVLVRRTMEPGL